MLLTNVAKMLIPTTHDGNEPSAFVNAAEFFLLLNQKEQPKRATPPTKMKKTI
ncbi:unknown [Bacteroides sp. CAG:709]|nr:unknown [Bacteroides sp. CAG:709]